MVLCGWCGHPTESWETTALPVEGWECRSCGHEDPAKPYVQRGRPVPHVTTDAAGRPALDPTAIRRKLQAARAELPDATNEQLAEHLGISVRTLGRWRQLAD